MTASSLPRQAVYRERTFGSYPTAREIRRAQRRNGAFGIYLLQNTVIAISKHTFVLCFGPRVNDAMIFVTSAKFSLDNVIF